MENQTSQKTEVTITLTSEEYSDLLYALILAIEVCNEEKNPRGEKIKKLFEEL